MNTQNRKNGGGAIDADETATLCHRLEYERRHYEREARAGDPTARAISNAYAEALAYVTQAQRYSQKNSHAAAS